ncbi:hypothetical protein BJV78DRAFT_865123 [Lactifluus subvellereus]|nr:hypothetical protein BJV78DRAFT_865123 [Lactifluus subvellereus]
MRPPPVSFTVLVIGLLALPNSARTRHQTCPPERLQTPCLIRSPPPLSAQSEPLTVYSILKRDREVSVAYPPRARAPKKGEPTLDVGSIWRDSPAAFSYTRSIRHVAGQSSSEQTRVVYRRLLSQAYEGACVIDVLAARAIPSPEPAYFMNELSNVAGGLTRCC